MNQELSSPMPQAELLFDWKLDVERLEREARAAVRSTTPDDWTLVEAECSQDLISAELTALKAKTPRTPAVTASIEHLQSWALRLDRVVRQLRSLHSERAL